jgi:hypothetical protein
MNMIKNQNQQQRHNIAIFNKSFKSVSVSGTALTSRNEIHDGIKIRMHSENAEDQDV